MPTANTPAFRPELLPAPRSFFEEEIGRLTRPNSKGWALGRCPFHKSKSGRSLSVNLQSVRGHFRCFGCDAHGDMISFVMLRDKCDFKTAAKTLGCWRNVSDDERRELDLQAARRREQKEKEERRKQLAHAELIELRNELLLDIEIQADASIRLSALFAGEVPEHADEPEHLWSILSLIEDDIRDLESRYMAAAGFGRAA